MVLFSGVPYLTGYLTAGMHTFKPRCTGMSSYVLIFQAFCTPLYYPDFVPARGDVRQGWRNILVFPALTIVHFILPNRVSNQNRVEIIAARCRIIP